MSKTISLLRNLAIVVGTTILGVVGPDGLKYFLSEKERPHLLTFEWITGLLVLSLVFILYGFDIFTSAARKLRLFFRNIHWFDYRIGILYTRDKDIECVWTDIAPEEWRTLIDNAAGSFDKKIKVRLIQVNQSFDSYHVIINPYGGNYPEINFYDFPVYNRILEYMRSGGFFVNVADIPTYHAHNSRLRRKIDRTPAVYGATGEESRLFSRTPLIEELAVRVNNVEDASGTIWPFNLKEPYSKCRGTNFDSLKPSRAAIVEKNVESVVEPFGDNLTPLFFCSYGDGCCLISLSWLNKNFSQNRPLAAIISKIIIARLLTNLRLDSDAPTAARQERVMWKLMHTIKSYFLALKASSRIGRVCRLRKKGRYREALEVARDGLRILSNPIVQRHNPAEAATLACLTIHVEELSAELQEAGASMNDLRDTLENLKSISGESSQKIQDMKAWIPYLEAKTGSSGRSGRTK